ncbi:MAG: hypothetical protein GY928_02175 [Colwellia sp.]|nr:hypothetical protein [Colwellia sp.]
MNKLNKKLLIKIIKKIIENLLGALGSIWLISLGGALIFLGHFENRNFCNLGIIDYLVLLYVFLPWIFIIISGILDLIKKFKVFIEEMKD